MNARAERYEYKVESWNDDVDEDEIFDLEEYLNKKGRKGWMLVKEHTGNGFYHFVFMRKLKE